MQPKVEVKEEVECSEVLKEEVTTEGVAARRSYDNIGELCDDSCVKAWSPYFRDVLMVSCSIVPESYSSFSVLDETVTICIKKENAEASIVQVRMEWFKYAGFF